MTRIALQVEYFGWGYHGFQAQPGLLTIQTQLQKALSSIANEPITVFCAGRTDANVHAYGQIVHFDTSAPRSMHAWVRGGNTLLPESIAIKWAQQVPDDFHARFSAMSRRYRYIIYNHPIKSAMIERNATWYYAPLDIDKMRAASTYLLGEHDFTSFRSSECASTTPMRHVTDITVQKNKDFIIFEIEANAFLHHMVRNIIGSLLTIGSLKQPPIWLQHVLAAKDRCKAGITAPPQGLYLLSVCYPKKYVLPSTPSPFSS